MALASFNVKERFFRVRFVAPAEKWIFAVEIDYEVFSKPKRSRKAPNSRPEDEEAMRTESSNEDSEDERPNSKGLLLLLTKVADHLGIELLRSSVDQKGRFLHSKVRQKRIEHGRITLAGRLKRKFTKIDELTFKQEFENSVIAFSDEHVNDKHVEVKFRDHIELQAKVTPWQTKKVFWSSIFEHNKHAELFKLASEACKKYGMDLVRMKEIVCSLEKRSRTTTPEIVQKVKEADAVIQLVCMRENDKEKVLFHETWHPEYVWLHSEYAIAHTLGKPIVRLLDTSMPGPICDQFDKYNRDEFFEKVDLRWSNESIKQKFEEVAAELRARLTNSES